MFYWIEGARRDGIDTTGARNTPGFPGFIRDSRCNLPKNQVVHAARGVDAYGGLLFIMFLIDASPPTPPMRLFFSFFFC
jgi:hypothetical protein